MLGGVQGGGMQGGGMPGQEPPRGGSPLGEPRLRREGPPSQGGGLGDILGGAMGGGGMGGGGLGGILGGLLGGMAGGNAPAGRAGEAPSGGGLGGLAGSLGGMKGMALMALLAYLMQGRGGTAGLSALTQQLRGAGLDDRVDSWVGPGANRELRPDELARAIPPDAMDTIERQTGLGRDEVLAELSRGLPGMVDRLTPRGHMPERDEELDDIDEGEVLGNFGIGGVPGAPFGKFGPGQSGGRKS
jgi:uncharacterized protein YidB (DUF937 family)